MSKLDQYKNRNKPIICLAFVVLSIVVYLMVNNKIDLIDFNSRLRYVLLHLTPGIAWILLSSWFVIQKRLTSPAIDPMDGYEKVTEVSKNNLTNSCEQFLMSSVSQLILVIHLESNIILNIIPILNLMFIAGRVAFWVGYPRYRSFGFMLTNYPIIATIAYNLYKFFRVYI